MVGWLVDLELMVGWLVDLVLMLMMGDFFSVSVSKVGTILFTSMCLSRLELTSDNQTSASNSPSE